LLAGLVSVLSDPNLNATLLAPNDAVSAAACSTCCKHCWCLYSMAALMYGSPPCCLQAFLLLLRKLTDAGRLVDKTFVYNTTSLLNDPNLSAILLYHLIPNEQLFQSSLFDGETLSSFSKHIVSVKR
jgi:hypothetical protein